MQKERKGKSINRLTTAWSQIFNIFCNINKTCVMVEKESSKDFDAVQCLHLQPYNLRRLTLTQPQGGLHNEAACVEVGDKKVPRNVQMHGKS